MKRKTALEWINLLRGRSRQLKQTYHAAVQEKRCQEFLDAAAENDELADYLQAMVDQSKMLQDELAANMDQTRFMAEKIAELQMDIKRLEK